MENKALFSFQWNPYFYIQLARCFVHPAATEVYIILTVLILPLISHGVANILSGAADMASKAAKICQHGAHCNQHGEFDGADSSFLTILWAKKHFPTLQKVHTFSRQI